MSDFIAAPTITSVEFLGTTWTAVPGATHYKVYKRLPSTTAYTLHDTVAEADLIDMGLLYPARGEWDAETSYSVNDIVQYAGSSYIAAVNFNVECNGFYAPTLADCSSTASFNPAAYPAGWTLMAERTSSQGWPERLLQYAAVSAVIDNEDVQIESALSPEVPVWTVPLTPVSSLPPPPCSVPPSKPRWSNTFSLLNAVDLTWLPPDQPIAEDIKSYRVWYEDPALPNTWLDAEVIGGNVIPNPPNIGGTFITPGLGVRLRLWAKTINGKPATYRVRVSRNSECGNNYSDPIEVAPLAASLSPATNVTATPAPGGIRVRWVSGPTGGDGYYSARTPVTLADIYYTTALSKPWRLAVRNAIVSNEGTLVSGLQNFTNYIFAVQRKYTPPVTSTNPRPGELLAAFSEPTQPTIMGPWVMVGTNVGEEPPTSAGFTTRYTLSSNVVWHYPMYSAQLPNPPINTVLPIVTTKHITRPSLPAGTTIDQLPHRLYQLPLTGNTLVVRRGGTTLSWTGGTTITVGRGSDAYPPFRGMTTTLEGVIGADGVNQPNQKVFVVNSGDGTVSIVDVATSAVTDTIDVKTAGRTELYSGVSYNTATGILYVTERNYGTIKAINVATKQIVGSIDLGVALYDVCVHKALNRLYVATEDAGIKVINLATAFSGGAAGTGVSTIVLPSDGVYGYGKTRGLYLSLAEARNLLIAGGRNNPEEIIANDSSGTPIRTMKNGSLFVINCTSNDIVGKKNFNGNVTGVGLDENGLIYCLENAYYNSGWRTPGRMRAFNLNSISLEVGLQYFNYPSGMQLNNVNVGAAPGHLHIGPYQDTGAGLFVSQGKSMSFSSRPRNARWHHGDKRVLLAWEAPNAPMPSNFSGYDIFSRISPAANDQAAIYTRLRTVPPQTTWIDVTSHAGAPLENNRSYDFRIVPSFLGLGVNAGKFSGYGQPLQTFTNIVPRPLWNFVNINAMPSSAAQLKRDYISAGGYWNTVVALPAAVYTALAGYLSFSGVVISSQDTNEPGQYWAANCAASFALIVTASGGYVVPVSCMITRNLAYTQSTAVLAHELGHALGIGSSSTWNTGVTQPTWCPSKYLLSGTIFKNALIGYQEHVRLRNSLDRRVFTHIPLLSVWPYSLSGAVGLHWEHASTNCQSWLPGVPGELMSYDRNNNVRTNVSVGALLDMGYRLCQTNETFKAHFMETAERPAANAMSMQSAPVWVPNETPQEILAPQENGDVGGCCVSANIIGTLYLDGTEPTNV